MRHGQVANHEEQRYNGHFDVGITDEGAAQMERLGELLKEQNLSALYSSDLERSARGGVIIGEAIGVKHIEREAFREVALGRWDGLTREEGAALYPEEVDFRFRDLATKRLIGGESLIDVQARVLPALKVILETHEGESIGIVAHGGVNRVILSTAMGLPIEHFYKIEQDYGCLNLIDYLDDGTGMVKVLNGGPNQHLCPTVLY